MTYRLIAVLGISLGCMCVASTRAAAQGPVEAKWDKFAGNTSLAVRFGAFEAGATDDSLPLRLEAIYPGERRRVDSSTVVLHFLRLYIGDAAARHIFIFGADRDLALLIDGKKRYFAKAEAYDTTQQRGILRSEHAKYRLPLAALRAMSVARRVELRVGLYEYSSPAAPTAAHALTTALSNPALAVETPQ